MKKSKNVPAKYTRNYMLRLDNLHGDKFERIAKSKDEMIGVLHRRVVENWLKKQPNGGKCANVQD